MIAFFACWLSACLKAPCFSTAVGLVFFIVAPLPPMHSFHLLWTSCYRSTILCSMVTSPTLCTFHYKIHPSSLQMAPALASSFLPGPWRLPAATGSSVTQVWATQSHPRATMRGPLQITGAGTQPSTSAPCGTRGHAVRGMLDWSWWAWCLAKYSWWEVMHADHQIGSFANFTLWNATKHHSPVWDQKTCG